MPDNSKPGNLTGQSGGMADALDSKSCVRKGVWVRLPPLVLLFCGCMPMSSRLLYRLAPSFLGSRFIWGLKRGLSVARF